MKEETTRINIAPLRKLYEYWCQLRGDNLSPQRADLLPENLGPWLGHINLIDVIDQGERFRVRLHGTKVTEIFNHDLTGKYVDDFIPAEDLRYVLKSLKMLVETKRPHHVLIEYDEGGHHRYVEKIRLPIAIGENPVAIILSACYLVRDDQLPLDTNRYIRAHRTAVVQPL